MQTIKKKLFVSWCVLCHKGFLKGSDQMLSWLSLMIFLVISFGIISDYKIDGMRYNTWTLCRLSQFVTSIFFFHNGSGGQKNHNPTGSGSVTLIKWIKNMKALYKNA